MTNLNAPGPDAPAVAVPRASFWRSPAAKFFLIALLSVLLLVPLLFVYALTAEREERRSEVVATLARTWAGPQHVAGPVLVVPYVVRSLGPADPGTQPAQRLQRRHAVILPESLDLAADLSTEPRSLSIFDVPVYTAALTLQARFGRLGPERLPREAESVDWGAARIALALSDLTGIETAGVTANGAELTVEPGFGTGLVARSDQTYLSGDAGPTTGVGAPLAPGLAASAVTAGLDVSVTLRLRGMERFAALPLGRQSTIRMQGTWPDPGFSTGLLPSERTVGATGFTALWRVPHLARDIPGSFDLEDAGLGPFAAGAVGVDLTDRVDTYALVDRALKFGLMFVGAVFGIVFVLEVLSPRRIHVVQYAIVGMILVFFYVLLLALAERIGFGPAYAAASVATGGVVATFVGLQLESRARAVLAALGFAALFGLDYVILRLEDVALIAGAISGFLLLTAVLFATRRVDWSGRGAPEVTPTGPVGGTSTRSAPF